MIMDTYLINRNSPIRSGIEPNLRHRSRPSESESIVSQFNPNDVAQADKSSIPDTIEPMAGDGLKENSNSEANGIPVKGKSMLGYFMSELTRGYRLEGDASKFAERRDRVYTSVNTPKNLEKFCAFGFLQCLDSILYMVTFLPLRIVVALIGVLTHPIAVIFRRRTHALDAAQICDLLKGVILVVSCFITSSVDMSMIYHIVRGQSIIKFYVFYNMLDVMDKLISGFGQDVLDSLYWTAVEPREWRREHFGTLFHLIFAIVYVVIHTVMILMQAIILNVAFNSHNKNLLTIMMSNNFVEIKGNLFKRLDKNNLCQITYSDVKERFHYLVLLLFVFIRNMKELQWNWDLAYPIMQDVVIVLLVEMIVDWIKHAFITKFNELSASLYADFALGLAQDIASSQKKHAFTNFSDQVCRRMGFTPMPLICLLFMVCSKSFDIDGPLPWLLVLLFYMCLMSTKVLNSIILLGWAQRLIAERDKNAKTTGTVVNSQVVPKKEEKGSSLQAKPETQVPSPGSLSPARSSPVSSNAAVNTDSSLYLESPSQLSLAHDEGDGNWDYVAPTDVSCLHHRKKDCLLLASTNDNPLSSQSLCSLSHAIPGATFKPTVNQNHNHDVGQSLAQGYGKLPPMEIETSFFSSSREASIENESGLMPPSALDSPRTTQVTGLPRPVVAHPESVNTLSLASPAAPNKMPLPGSPESPLDQEMPLFISGADSCRNVRLCSEQRDSPSTDAVKLSDRSTSLDKIVSARMASSADGEAMNNATSIGVQADASEKDFLNSFVNESSPEKVDEIDSPQDDSVPCCLERLILPASDGEKR